MSYMSYIDTRPELVMLMELESQLCQSIRELRHQRTKIREYITSELVQDQQ